MEKLILVFILFSQNLLAEDIPCEKSYKELKINSLNYQETINVYKNIKSGFSQKEKDALYLEMKDRAKFMDLINSYLTKALRCIFSERDIEQIMTKSFKQKTINEQEFSRFIQISYAKYKSDASEELIKLLIEVGSFLDFAKVYPSSITSPEQTIKKLEDIRQELRKYSKEDPFNRALVKSCKSTKKASDMSLEEKKKYCDFNQIYDGFWLLKKEETKFRRELDIILEQGFKGAS